MPDTRKWMSEEQPEIHDAMLVLMSNGLVFPSKRANILMTRELGHSAINMPRELRKLRGDPNWQYY